MTALPLHIAMLSLHSSPMGPLGTRWTGGMSVVLAATARELARRGHRVDIFTHRTDPRLPEVVPLGPGVRVVHLTAGPPAPAPPLTLFDARHDLTLALEAFRVRRAARYDLIHSHYWLSGVVGLTLGARWAVPHLITFHTLAAVKDATLAAPPEPALRREQETILVRRCQRLLAPTPGEVCHLVVRYGADPGRIGLVPCGVDLKLFRPVSRGLARRRLGLTHAGRRLLFVGRPDPMKGLERLLDALALLHPPAPDLMVVGGDDPGSDAWQGLASAIHARGLEQRVAAVGRVPPENLRFYYSAADAVVVPSVYESFGLVLLEALACGTPVVATPVGAAPGLITIPEAGRVTGDAAPPSLARGISAVLAAPSNPSRAATRRLVRPLAWRRVTAKLESEYLRILGRRAQDG
jgi:D-inositol-3-phosphate glycosyltransferase